MITDSFFRFCVAAICLWQSTTGAFGDPVVAVINGEPVSASEYRLVMDRKSAEVYTYFKQTRNLDDHLGYWSEDSGPDGPLAKLRQIVRDELTRIKVCQGLAKSRGLLADTTFTAFQSKFERENARRLAAKSAGEVVYGPTQYRMPMYYYVQFGNLIHELTRTLAIELEPALGEDEIMALYREKEAEFQSLTWEESRKAIVRFLSRQKAEAQLKEMQSSAVVTFEEPLLRDLVPRLDPPQNSTPR